MYMTINACTIIFDDFLPEYFHLRYKREMYISRVNKILGKTNIIPQHAVNERVL